MVQVSGHRLPNQNQCSPACVSRRVGLTPRSSGAPTAGHQARACGTPYIVTGPGLAPCRCRPLSSNVRQRRNDRARAQESQRLSAWAKQPQSGEPPSVRKPRGQGEDQAFSMAARSYYMDTAVAKAERGQRSHRIEPKLHATRVLRRETELRRNVRLQSVRGAAAASVHGMSAAVAGGSKTWHAIFSCAGAGGIVCSPGRR
jgi:hypothetical protein